LSDRPRILVADDEERILLLLETVLDGAGYEVRTSNNGTEAIKSLEENEVDAVITDMNMPGANGIEVINATRRLYGPTIPIIVITAYGSVQNAVEAMHHGATDYLEKPFDMTELRDCLAKWLKEADNSNTQGPS